MKHFLLLLAFCCLPAIGLATELAQVVATYQPKDSLVRVSFIITDAPAEGVKVSMTVSTDDIPNFTHSIISEALQGALDLKLPDGPHTIYWDPRVTFAFLGKDTIFKSTTVALTAEGINNPTITITSVADPNYWALPATIKLSDILLGQDYFDGVSGFGEQGIPLFSGKVTSGATFYPVQFVDGFPNRTVGDLRTPNKKGTSSFIAKKYPDTPAEEVWINASRQASNGSLLWEFQIRYKKVGGKESMTIGVVPGSGYLTEETEVTGFSVTTGIGTSISPATAVYVFLPFFHVDILDPNPTLIGIGGNLINDPKAASLIGTKRIGTTTDSLSKLLIVARTDKAGVVVEFEIEEDPDNLPIGSLNYLKGGPPMIRMLVESVSTGDENVAVAVYTPPNSFGLAPTSGHDRYVSLHISSKDNPKQIENRLLSLVRPPLVLVHGTWSSPEIFKKSGFSKYMESGGFELFPADYSKHNAETFDPRNISRPGIEAVKLAIKEGLSASRGNNIAATQADVVCHSLGGLQTRGLIAQPDAYYKVLSTYYQGYIHRLITIATPHSGTRMGTFLYEHKDDLVWLGPQAVTLDYFMTSVSPHIPIFGSGPCPLDKGAVRDQSWQSEMIKSMPETRVPCHAIGGIWLRSAWTSYLEIDLALHWITHDLFFGIPQVFNQPFGFLNHDMTVELESAMGQAENLTTDAQGIPLNDKKFVTIFPNVVHSMDYSSLDVSELGSKEIQAWVSELLRSSDPTLFAESFPLPIVNGAKEKPPAIQSIRHTPQSGDGKITLTSPAHDTVFKMDPHTSITLSARIENTKQADRILFIVSGIGMFAPDDSAGLSVTFNVPPYADLGRCNVSVLVLDSSGRSLSDTGSFVLVNSSPPLQLFVEPKSVIIFPNLQQTKQLYVYGEYLWDTSFTLVNLSAHESTLYASRRGIVSVSKNGLISGSSPGVDTIDVSNSGISVVVPVTIVNSDEPSSVSSPTHSAKELDFDIYPNPFQSATTFAFDLKERTHISLSIYDVLGRKVAMVLDDDLDAGRSEKSWKPSELSSGIYFCHYQADGLSGTKKLLYQKN